MKMNLRAKVLGLEDRVSKKGLSYTVCLLHQGVDTLNLMLPVGSVLEVDRLYDFVIDYNSQWKSLKLISSNLVK